ncbi:hypothetical protein Syncc8109_1772 [Synechococcus sp. WH 8109]|nr:hypothetical protein Syncc8109_1772 [Synechococcus sp. WH 8109]
MFFTGSSSPQAEDGALDDHTRFSMAWGRVLAALDSHVVREEVKWSSTPSGKQIPHACRIKMRLPFERSAEASCFLQAASIAGLHLPKLIQAYYKEQSVG